METVLPSALISGSGVADPAKSKWPSLWLRSSLWEIRIGRGREKGISLGEAVLTDRPAPIESAETQSDNWVMKILQVRSIQENQITDDLEESDVSVYLKPERREKEGEAETETLDCEGCSVDEDVIAFDRDSFSQLLTRVSLTEAKTYARLSNLGNLAYCIPRMKEKNKLERYGFHFVTSSFDERGSTDTDDEHELPPDDEDDDDQISESAAYRAVASAASYLYSQGNSPREIASFRATSDSVTCVVAAEEEVKQAVANDLSSTRSPPCEWYVCDDDDGTRYFVIQGSETLESWKANLLFEPAEFEGTGFPVHRGIYEAAKGMYEMMISHVRSHLESTGERARFRFTGHSLGGSLSVLLTLMLRIRGGAPASSLLPAVTFGAPSVMCGGDELLRSLGLPRSHVRAVTMHRDIVPRAFSCHYPNHVAQLLKAVNGRFRRHACLDTQNVLYAPMGDLLILQPDEGFSPGHELLPEGAGLYRLTCQSKVEQQAARTFMNTPHPLEILMERSAYGDGGTVQRDHDMNSYVRCVRGYVRQQQSRQRRPQRRTLSDNAVIAFGHVAGEKNIPCRYLSLSRLTRLVASRHVNMLLLLLLPARLLLSAGLDTI